MIELIDSYICGFVVCCIACVYLLVASFCSNRWDTVPVTAVGLSCSIAGVFVCLKSREVLKR